MIKVLGKEVTRAEGRFNNVDSLFLLLRSLSNVKIIKYFNYNPRLNGICRKDNVINLNDKQQSKGAHWISLFIVRNTALYFDCFVIEYIPQEVN